MGNNIKSRVCRECGATFQGGPRAWYCISCRKERLREQKKIYNKNGFARHLGDIDLCIVCNQPYTVNSGLQKYCPKCSTPAIREKDREQGLKWYYDNAEHINPIRNYLRSKKTTLCAICGKEFPCDGTVRNTCSEQCRKIKIKAYWKRADAKRRKKVDRMIFPTFIRLLNQVNDYDDFDMYVAERGWEPWMDKYKDSDIIAKVLSIIWDIGKSGLPELKSLLHISRAEMSRRYQIPLRTLENWDGGQNAPADFVRNLLCYSVFINVMEGDDGNS